MAVKSILKSSVTNKKIVTPNTINIKIISKFNSIGMTVHCSNLVMQLRSSKYKW